MLKSIANCRARVVARWVKQQSPWKVTKQNTLYSCGWSPLEGKDFSFNITHTIVNGNIVYKDGSILNIKNGKELDFYN